MTTAPYLDQQHSVPRGQKTARPGHREAPLEREEWITQATCRQGDPDALFVKGAEQRTAAALCRHCPVRRHCLAAALDNRENFGVWGGLTERQRRSLLRKNPHVGNWAEYLAAGGKLTGI